jgi:putative transposase
MFATSVTVTGLGDEHPFRYFNGSPEVIRLVVTMYARCQLSRRNVEDLRAERGIDISHETVRFWNRSGRCWSPRSAKRRVAHMRGGHPQWQWRLVEVLERVNEKLFHLWRAVDYEGEVLKLGVTAKRDRRRL